MTDSTKTFAVPGVLALFILAGCAQSTVNETSSILVDDFAEVEANVGQHVTVHGYISQRHEAVGLYFSMADMNDYNNKCIRPKKMNGLGHQDKVTLTGRLTRSRCASELVCTNACSDYTLDPLTPRSGAP